LKSHLEYTAGGSPPIDAVVKEDDGRQELGSPTAG
jgi:hypothetical protein